MRLPSSTRVATQGGGFSRDEIEAIRTRHPIEQVVANYADLRSTGRLLQAICPLPGHDEKEPSFTVYTDRQSFFCYGCHRGGDVFKFVQLVEQLDFREAVARLETGGATTPLQVMPLTRGIFPSRKPIDEPALDLLTAAAEVYHASLMLDDAMLAYLLGRGITLETIERYRLGYATGDNLAKYFRFRGWDLDLGRELGLIGEHVEFFRHRIILPEWRDGKAIYLCGRKTLEYQQVKYLGLPGASKPLYGLEAVQGAREVFVVEGAFDLLTLLQWGYPAVALLGSHLKKGWIEELGFAERIYVATDSDDAGRAAAKTIAELLGPRALILPPLPLAKDVNELAQLADGRETFARLVSQVRVASGEN